MGGDISISMSLKVWTVRCGRVSKDKPRLMLTMLTWSVPV